MLKIATLSDVKFYEDKLYPFQDEICRMIQNDKFYLSGGTCLSRYYYQHRYSDDLDFFYDGNAGSKEGFSIETREIIKRIAGFYKTEIEIDREYFKRLIIYAESTPLKLEFIYENFTNIGTRTKSNGIMLDTKENLTANKLTAAYDRKTVKDFVDLFYLMQEFSFEQTAEWANQKITPLDYEGMAIVFADSRLEGEVVLKKAINNDEFILFVENLINWMFEYAKNS